MLPNRYLPSPLPPLIFHFVYYSNPFCGPFAFPQEFIRHKLEEEQRQLEILQQQLLQEQALLMVTAAHLFVSVTVHLITKSK